MLSGRAAFFVCTAAAIILTGYVAIKLIGTFFVSNHEINTTGFNDGERTIVTYDRSHFGNWVDNDADCINTRGELLLMKSEIPVSFSSTGCTVTFGRWLDVYRNQFIDDAALIDVDHLVPLSFAWKIGASRWSDAERLTFFNDQENLIITSSSLNRSKGNSSPLEWMPPQDDFHCTYIERFSFIIKKYQLTPDPTVIAGLRHLQSQECT